MHQHNNTIESQEVREVKVAELCKWATLTALLTGETLSLPPFLSFSLFSSLSLFPSHHQWQKVRLSLFKGYASVELREQEWCHKFPPGTRPSLFAPLELLSGFKEQQIKKMRKKKNERKEN